MRTLTPEEYKKKYGETSYNSFAKPEQGRFSDAGEDLVSGAKGLGGDFMKRGRNVIDSVKAGAGKEQSLLETGGQVVGQVLGGAGDIIGRGVTTAGSLALKQSEEDAVAEGFGTAVAGVDKAIGISDYYNTLSDRSKRNISGIAGGLEFATFKGIGSITNSTAKRLLAQSDDVLARSRAKVPPLRSTVTASTGAVNKIVKDARFALSDVDPQLETVIKQSDPAEINKYFQQARAHKADASKSTPLELAGSKAEEAFDVLEEAVRKAGDGKRAILADVADTRVSGDTINGVMSTGIQRMGSKYGVRIDANGKVTPLAGRTAVLDATDTGLVTNYFSKLNALGVTPTVKEVDDFVDWAQKQLYKQSKSLSALDVADKAVVADLKRVTGDLNGRLKTQVGGGYAEVNARMSSLLDMQDELSRALGADARKGGGLMKRIYSPTSGNTRPLFNQIKEETGIDLFKEAGLAKFSMESVGDANQRNLLKQLDLAIQSSQELDLTKPASWYNWLRERADLDGQELAQEIARRERANN